MAILNYTTTISVKKTIGEIQSLLSKKGARKIVVDYNDSHQPVNITFGIMWNSNMVAYSLPCRHEGVLKVLIKQNVPRALRTEQQALRVSWRIIKTWIEAQMAIIESEIASLAEVFLPYAVTKDGKTLYEQLNENNDLLLLN